MRESEPKLLIKSKMYQPHLKVHIKVLRHKVRDFCSFTQKKKEKRLNQEQKGQAGDIWLPATQLYFYVPPNFHIRALPILSPLLPTTKIQGTTLSLLSTIEGQIKIS